MEGTTRHCNIPNIYAVGILVSERKVVFFKVFLITSLSLEPQGRASLDPRDLIGRFYGGNH